MIIFARAGQGDITTAQILGSAMIKSEKVETVFVSMGLICGTIKESVNELRNGGEKAGVLRLVTYRPFLKKFC